MARWLRIAVALMNGATECVPVLPTSGQDCKQGGWATYGVFKNQGDCVSYVATGGKNPPAYA